MPDVTRSRLLRMGFLAAGLVWGGCSSSAPFEYVVPEYVAVEFQPVTLAENALLSVESYPQPSPPAYAVALPMPKAPRPGQKKPPCEPGYEVAALGACWVVSFEKKPPCGTVGYDYDGKCIRASFEAPRVPTSGEP